MSCLRLLRLWGLLDQEWELSNQKLYSWSLVVEIKIAHTITSSTKCHQQHIQQQQHQPESMEKRLPVAEINIRSLFCKICSTMEYTNISSINSPFPICLRNKHAYFNNRRPTWQYIFGMRPPRTSKSFMVSSPLDKFNRQPAPESFKITGNCMSFVCFWLENLQKCETRLSPWVCLLKENSHRRTW